MANYYEVLRSAVESVPDAGGRAAIYNRARRAMTDRMRAATPPIPDAVIEAEQTELEKVIDRVEEEMRGEAPAEPASISEIPETGLGSRRALPRWIVAIVAVVVAAIIAVLATTFLRSGPKSIERSAGN
jgi:hypothetical protein